MAVTFTATGDVSALEREYLRLQKQYAALSAELAKLTTAQGDFERSGADSARIKNLAAQQYAATVRILSDELRKGTITQAQHDAQLAAAKEKYSAITKEAKDQAAAAKELATHGKAAGDAFGAMPKPLASAKAEVLGMVTGWLSSITSITAILALLEKVKAEQRQIRQDQLKTQVTVAGAEAEAIQMLGTGKSEKEKTWFLAEVKKINQETGFGDMKALYSASANVLSSTAGDSDLTAKILRATAPLKKYRPDELESLAGSTADLATITGARTDEDVQRTVGLVLNITSQSRIKNLESFKNAAPALAAVANLDKGGDKLGALTEAGSIFAAIGGSIKDPEGSLTKTATAEVAGALERMLPQLGTTRERMAKVRSDPELQKEFWTKHGEEIEKKPGFRGPIVPAIRALLTDPTSEIARRYESAQKTLSGAGGQQALADYRSMVSDISGITPELALATQEKMATGNLEAFDVEQNKAARYESVYQQMDKVLSRGSGTISRMRQYLPIVGSRGEFRAKVRGGMSPERSAELSLWQAAEEIDESTASPEALERRGLLLRESRRFRAEGLRIESQTPGKYVRALSQYQEEQDVKASSDTSAAERTAAATEQLANTVANRPQVGTSALASWGQGAMREGR